MRKLNSKLPFMGGYSVNLAKPVNRALPAISGIIQVGQTLSASAGTWSNSPASYAYQWQNEGSAISGATAATYTLTTGDIGGLITVAVTATNLAGSSDPAISSLVGPTLGTTVFYVSSSTGSDSNPGTLALPWKTLTKVNAQSFSPGTSVLFKRGDTWRTDGNSPNSLGVQLRPKSSGSTGNPIVFDAYGTGPLPIFDGSFDASSTGAWTTTGTPNVWKSVQTFPPQTSNGLPYNAANDVGNILWGFSAVGGANVPTSLVSASAGVMTGGGVGGVWYKPGDGQAHLTSQGQWNFNTDNWTVQIYSTTNPATAMPGLSLAIDTTPIYFGQSNLIFQNLDIRKSAACGVLSGSGPDVDNIIVRDCVVQWIGGGNIGGGSTANSRYGDGTDTEGSTQNWLFERNYYYNVHDTAIGPQNGGAHQDSITVRNCVMVESVAAYVSFVFGTPGPTVDGAYFYNNTVFLNHGGWSVYPTNQRPNGVPNLTGMYLGVLAQTNIFINNNVFAGIKDFGIDGTHWGVDNLYSGTWLDYNDWPVRTRDNTAQVIALHSGNPTISSWAAAHGLETHGLFVDPQFTAQSSMDLSPSGGSPLLGAGKNLSNAGVVWDFNKQPRPAAGPFTIGAFQ